MHKLKTNVMDAKQTKKEKEEAAVGFACELLELMKIRDDNKKPDMCAEYEKRKRETMRRRRRMNRKVDETYTVFNAD